MPAPLQACQAYVTQLREESEAAVAQRIRALSTTLSPAASPSLSPGRLPSPAIPRGATFGRATTFARTATLDRSTTFASTIGRTTTLGRTTTSPAAAKDLPAFLQPGGGVSFLSGGAVSPARSAGGVHELVRRERLP